MELFFPVVANGIYVIKFMCILSGNNTTADNRIYFRTASATLLGRGWIGFTTTANAGNIGMLQSISNFSAAAGIGVPTANLNDMVLVEGSVAYHVNGNDTIWLGFGNNVNTPGAISRMWAGSAIEYKKIN